MPEGGGSADRRKLWDPAEMIERCRKRRYTEKIGKKCAAVQSVRTGYTEKGNEMERQKKSGSAGFSLVELMLVLAIMVLLVAISIPFITSYLQKGNYSSDEQLAENLKRAVSVALEEQRNLQEAEVEFSEGGVTLYLDRFSDFPGSFGASVAEKMGYGSAKVMTDGKRGITGKLKTPGAERIAVRIDQDGSCRSVFVLDQKNEVLLETP